MGAVHPVPAVPLGGVEGHVGRPHEIVEVVPAGSRRRETDADADVQLGPRRNGEAGDGPADHVGPGRRIREVREQAGELLPAHAAEDRSRRHQGTGRVTESDQDAVADGMTVGVVDALEMIEIEQQQRRVRGPQAQGRLGFGHEGPPVGDARERIQGGGPALEVFGPLLGQGHQDEGEGHGHQHAEASQNGEGGRGQESATDDLGAVQDRNGNTHGVDQRVDQKEDHGRIAGHQGFGSPPPDQRRRGEAEATRQGRSQDDAGSHGGIEVRDQARAAPEADAGHDRPRMQAPPFEGAGAHPD